MPITDQREDKDEHRDHEKSGRLQIINVRLTGLR